MPTGWYPSEARSASLPVLAGAAAGIGGLAWVVKAAAILATGDQPPSALEAAQLPFFGVALTALALTSDLRGGRRKTAIALGLLTVAAGVVAGVTEAVGQVWGPAVASSSLALVAGLLLFGRRASSASHKFAWWIGVSALPALVVGGLLSATNARLLEVSILTLGLMWLWLGGILLLERHTRQIDVHQVLTACPSRTDAADAEVALRGALRDFTESCSAHAR